MRTALILTGHVRTFDLVLSNLRKHVLDPFQPDVFGFMWSDTFGYHQHVQDRDHPAAELGYDPSSPRIPEDYVASVVERLRPAGFRCMDPAEVSSEIDALTLRHQDVRSHYEFHWERPKYQTYWSRVAGWRLKRQHEKANGFIYDRVIFSRWDVDHIAPLRAEQYPTDRLVSPLAYSYGAMCDFWAMGPSMHIDVFCNALTTIDLVKVTPGFHTNPHEWTRSHLDYYRVPYIIADVPIRLRR